MIRVLYVHEYGAPEHSRALDYMVECGSIRLTRLELSVLRDVAKGFLRQDGRLLRRAVYNIGILIALPFIRFDIAFVAVPPWDPRLALSLILRTPRCYLHTSWSRWGVGHGVRFRRSAWLRSLWLWLLRTRFAGIAGVSRLATTSVLDVVGKELDAWTVGHALDPFFFEGSLDGARDIDFVYVGRVVPEKGIEEFVCLAEQYPSYAFAVVGDGRLRSHLSADAPANLQFMGRLPSREVAAVLRRSRFLLQLSKSTETWVESFCLSIVEAMASGCIPVSTPEPGPLEVIEDGVDGIVLPSIDSLHKFAERASEVERDFDRCDLRRSADRFSEASRARVWESIVKSETD